MPLCAAYVMPHPPLAVDGVGDGSEKLLIPETMKSFHAIGKEISKIAPDTIVVSSPHSIIYSDYFHISPGFHSAGNFNMFGADTSMSIDYDNEFVSNLERFCSEIHFSAGTQGEENPNLDHGTMVPLFFVNQYYQNYDLVRVSLSGLSLNEHFIFGKMIKKVADKLDKKIVFIASGDLSHYQKDEGPYGYRPEGPIYDEKLMNTLSSGNLKDLLSFDDNLLRQAGECGHRSFCIMAGALDEEDYSVDTLSHENTFGVGYGFARINIKSRFNGNSDWENAIKLELERYYAGETQKFTAQMEAAIMESQDKDIYVALARKTIDALILGKELPDTDADDISDELKNKRAGTFVSIHKGNELRGCIGTIMATKKCIAEEIVANAISASTQDPRFPKVSEDELPFLEINVDVLTEPEPIKSADELDVKKYGVIVQNDHRLGILLPDLDGVDTIEQQISIAKRKAGISENEACEMYRFTVSRHK